MKIEIKSDYVDGYDHWFDLVGDAIFQRRAVGSWETSRSEMFRVFAALGLQSPAFGPLGQFPPETQIVLYVDPFAHAGEGKLLLSAGDAIRLHETAALAALARDQTRLTPEDVTLLLAEFPRQAPVCLGYQDGEKSWAATVASEFVGDFPGVTWRLLSAGGNIGWFRHESYGDWRSNAGDGQLFAVAAGEAPPTEFLATKIRNPVWAIDFIGRKGTTSATPELLAIDFNTAPKLAGTPLAKAWSMQAVAAGIGEMTEAIFAASGPGPATSKNRHGHEVSALDNNRILLA